MARLALNKGSLQKQRGQLEQFNLIALHDLGYTAEGILIGVLDTGFHRGHEAFNQPGHEIDVVLEYDFINDDDFTGIEPGDPSAQHNHGTMILGTIASYLPGVLIGGAFDASFILCKTEDATDEYQQEEDFYVAGLQFITHIDPKSLFAGPYFLFGEDSTADEVPIVWFSLLYDWDFDEDTEKTGGNGEHRDAGVSAHKAEPEVEEDKPVEDVPVYEGEEEEEEEIFDS